MVDLAKIQKEYEDHLKKDPEKLLRKYFEANAKAHSYERGFKLFQEEFVSPTLRHQEMLLKSFYFDQLQKDKHSWKRNLSQQEIADNLGCSARTIRNKRKKSELWEKYIQPDENHSKKWKILSAAIPTLQKESGKLPEK